MKINVLHLIGSFHQGGSERQAVQLSRLLHNEGSYKVFLGCLDKSGVLINEIDWCDGSEIPEFRLSSFHDTNFLRKVVGCTKFIRTNSISLVHTHDFYTNIFGMMAGTVARVPVRVASKRETFSKSASQILVEHKVAFKLADRILVNSEAVRRFLTQTRVPDRKILTIYNGIELDRFPPNQASCGNFLIETRIPVDKETRIVTIVANLRSDVKNHRMFLKAARSVKQHLGNVAFIIAGEGELLEFLRQCAKDYGISSDVHFVGGRANIGNLLAVSDVCVLSSRSEGFSNAILEYMAAGKPIVATNVGGAAEAVVNGETGYLVESDDDEAMSKRIIELLSDPHKAKVFGERGRKMVEARFTPATQLASTLKLYDELLAKHSKRFGNRPHE